MFEYVITVQLSKVHVAFRLQTHLFVPTKTCQFQPCSEDASIKVLERDFAKYVQKKGRMF